MLTGVPLDQCSRVFNPHNVSIGPMQVCAGGEKRAESCKVDSDGPLMGNDKSNSFTFLIGVFSFGPRQCGTEGWPDVFTRVNSYLAWILSHTHA